MGEEQLESWILILNVCITIIYNLKEAVVGVLVGCSNRGRDWLPMCILGIYAIVERLRN